MTLLIPLLYAFDAFGEVERVEEEEEGEGMVGEGMREEEEEKRAEGEEEEPRMGRGRDIGMEGMGVGRDRLVGRGETGGEESSSSEFRSITSTSFSSISIPIVRN